MKERQGLVIVHTGNGKGKTTAALGMGLRAWGQGMKVLVLQFIKGGWKYGELNSAVQMGENFVMRQLGDGFVSGKTGEEKEQHQAMAQAALQEARQEIQQGGWDMIILDEINYAVKFGLVETAEVLALIQQKPQQLHLVLTGRDAREEIIEAADLVTEMREIKHPYKKGIKAQQGVEF